MSKTLKVLLLTNYRKDEQRSMLRFGKLLAERFDPKAITCEEIFPKPCFFHLAPTPSMKKWGGYLDKYLIFPRRLKKALRSPKTRPDLFHVIDHSNAVYLDKVPLNPPIKKLVTCHDLIALRMARNEFDHAPRVSRTGQKLQNWIHRSLSIADAYACDSSVTEKDLHRLVPHSKGRSKVIHLGVERATTEHSTESSLPFEPSNTNYILHVGSSAWYKNRKGVLEAFINLRKNHDAKNPHLVFVGPELQSEEMTHSMTDKTKELSKHIIVLNKVSESALEMLYKNAKALIFPSFAEGFGWPPLEARALDCPVIASKTGAIHDILGDSATYVDPKNQKEINQAMLNAMNKEPLPQSSNAIPTTEDCARNYTSLYLRTMKHSHA